MRRRDPDRCLPEIVATWAGFYFLGFPASAGLPNDDIRLRQRIQSDPATGTVARIDLEIEVPREFPETYLPAKLRAAEQCAVKDHVDHAPQFVGGTVSV